MDITNRRQIADLLRAAAASRISEETFWDQFKALIEGLADGRVAEAYESAVHYWGNFHARNLYFMKVKPDPLHVENDAAELRTIADALEGDWPVELLRKRLKDGV